MGFVWEIIEFLIGFLVLPRIITFLWILVTPLLGLFWSVAFLVILNIVVLVLIFFLRKMIAIGFLVSLIIDILAVIGVVSLAFLTGGAGA